MFRRPIWPRALVAFCLTLLGANLAAQSGRTCGTMSFLQQLLAQNPQASATMSAIEASTQAFIAQGAPVGDVVRRIPVVVHVVWNTPAENISTAQVQSQIQVLNEDFRRTNPDASNTPSIWQPIAVDTEIEFCLATVDPLGNPTTGITRTQTSVTAFSQSLDNVKFTAQGGINAWPSSQYLNIWVCDLSNTLLGYAQFPGSGPANTDGVVVLTTAFGRNGSATAPFNLGRTCTHEVGHWLNLRHIWGDNEPLCGDDLVPDTPQANGPNYGCALSASSCGGANMVQNYMDYSDDACFNLFTAGQKNRMQALFAGGGARESLLTSPAACPTAPPQPAIYQTNQIKSALTINGAVGTGTVLANTIVPTSTTVTGTFTSSVVGAPWDTLLSTGAAVPRNGGAYVTPGGQIINMSAAVPFLFVLSGTTTPAYFPFPGSFTVTVTPPGPTTITLQSVVVTPTGSDGFALSQPCQLSAVSGSAPCMLILPNGPTGDDSSTTVALNVPGCSLSVPFYGTLLTQFFVSSNGRVVFGSADTAFAPSILSARSNNPFVGFWTDLNPSAGGSIALSMPARNRIRCAWNSVRYFGETVGVSFAVEFDTTSGFVVLDSLQGIPANPETQPAGGGQNQFLGISPGAGGTSPGPVTFAPGTGGISAASTDMLFDFYDQATTTGGLVPSLVGNLSRITFIPVTNGNYSFVAQ